MQQEIGQPGQLVFIVVVVVDAAAIRLREGGRLQVVRGKPGCVLLGQREEEVEILALVCIGFGRRIRQGIGVVEVVQAIEQAGCWLVVGGHLQGRRRGIGSGGRRPGFRARPRPRLQFGYGLKRQAAVEGTDRRLGQPGG